nr:MAG TPA: hypothetical protein [Herelleviridae sp.]
MRRILKSGTIYLHIDDNSRLYSRNVLLKYR